jgi:hypothetical protein
VTPRDQSGFTLTENGIRSGIFAFAAFSDENRIPPLIEPETCFS